MTLTRREAAAAGGATAALWRSAPAAGPLADVAVAPFCVAAPQRELDELKLRLRMTRLPSRETAPGYQAPGIWPAGMPRLIQP